MQLVIRRSEDYPVFGEMTICCKVMAEMIFDGNVRPNFESDMVWLRLRKEESIVGLRYCPFCGKRCGIERR